MRVFLTGATGAVGRPLVRMLVAANHDVVAASRSDRNDARLREAGATPARVDVFDADALTRAAAGADVVVRLATSIPLASRPGAADWALNHRLRRDGTAALLDATRRVDAQAFLQESVAWVARPDDGQPFDEASPVNPDAITSSAAEAEAAAATASAAHGFTAATARLGWLFGADTAHTRMFAQLVRGRRLPVIRPEVPLAFLHTDDAARAFATLAAAPQAGVWHVAADEPVTFGAFVDAFADGLGAPRPWRVPKLVGRLGAGNATTRFLTTPMRTGNGALKAATDWTPTWPDAVAAARATGMALAAQ